MSCRKVGDYTCIDDVTGDFCACMNDTPQMPTGNIKIQSTTGGVNVSQNTTTTDKILAFIPSVLATLLNRPYVPTTEQPKQQTYDDSAYLALLQQQRLVGNGVDDTGSIGGNFEQFIRANSTYLLIGAGLLVLVQMKPLSRKNPMRVVQNGIKQLVK